MSDKVESWRDSDSDPEINGKAVDAFVIFYTFDGFFFRQISAIVNTYFIV